MLWDWDMCLLSNLEFCTRFKPQWGPERQQITAKSGEKALWIEICRNILSFTVPRWYQCSRDTQKLLSSSATHTCRVTLCKLQCQQSVTWPRPAPSLLAVVKSISLRWTDTISSRPSNRLLCAILGYELAATPGECNIVRRPCCASAPTSP